MIAVVTGAAGGLGERIAQRLASDGYEVLPVDVLEADGGVQADLTTDAGVAAVVDAVDASGTPLGALVNSAGILRDARVLKMEEDAFKAVIDVNLIAAMKLTLALESRFAEGSSIVNLSSRAHLGNFGQTNYAASKNGLVGFTRALALQWAPRVRCNALAPSLVETPLTRTMPHDLLESFIEKIPMGRIGSPDDAAGCVSFLCSEDAAYVTGQTLLMCGGRSLSV